MDGSAVIGGANGGGLDHSGAESDMKKALTAPHYHITSVNCKGLSCRSSIHEVWQQELLRRGKLLNSKREAGNESMKFDR